MKLDSYCIQDPRRILTPILLDKLGRGSLFTRTTQADLWGVYRLDVDNSAWLLHDRCDGIGIVASAMSLFGELKRRNVFRVAAAYVAFAWLVIQVVEVLFPVFGLREAAIRVVVILLAIGFLPAVVSAWAFELTPEGFRREAEVDHDSPGSRRMTRRLDRLFIVALALALGFFAFDKFLLDPARDREDLDRAIEQAKQQAEIELRQTVRDRSIAVLAFQDLSARGDQEYFSDGLAVDLINQLGNVPALRVTGRTSAFSFKGKDVTIPQIGEALNVAHVLDGTVSRSGDRIRISVQLLDARQDTQLWSQTYDRMLGEIFDIRDDITMTVFDRLTIEFERLRERSRRTDPEAYDLTLRARQLWHTGDADDHEQAAALFEQALSIDPDYVPALLDSLRVNYFLMTRGLLTGEEHQRMVSERIRRVLNIDPDNGSALGFLAWADAEIHWDLESAARRYSEALKTAPGDLLLTRFAGMFARTVGRQDQSIALLGRCAAADPKGTCAWHLFLAYLWAGGLDEALDAYLSYELIGGRSGLYYGILTLLLRGEPDKALREFELAVQEQPDWRSSTQGAAAEAMIMNDVGQPAESVAAIRRGIAHVNPEFRTDAYFVAQAYAWIGQVDAAFDWLELAYSRDETYGNRGYWFQRNAFLPIWRKLHGDPRWDELLERVGLSPAQLERLDFILPAWIRVPEPEMDSG
jgi:TolB-like protein